MRTAYCVVAFSLLVTLAGCGGGSGRDLPDTVPGRGVVTLDGSPVEGASVTCIADSGSYHATAVTDATGAFSLKAFPEKDGAIPGSYKVAINKTIVGAAGGPADEPTVNVQLGVPLKYARTRTSNLAITIPEAGVTDLKIELTSK